MEEPKDCTVDPLAWCELGSSTEPPQFHPHVEKFRRLFYDRRVMLVVSPLAVVDARGLGMMCIVMATGR